MYGDCVIPLLECIEGKFLVNALNLLQDADVGAGLVEPLKNALDARTKQIIAVAVAHVTQCPWCIEGHVRAARRAGATPEQIMEAIWVAAEMRAGAAFAHSIKALDLMEDDPAS